MKNMSFCLALASAVTFTMVAEDAKPPIPAAAAAPTNSLPEVTARFKSVEERNAYAIGMLVGGNISQNIKRNNWEVSPEVIARAFEEVLTGKNTLMSSNDAQMVFKAYSTELSAKAEAKRKAEGAANLKAGQEFLAANKSKDGIITLASGLQYKVLTEGTGPKPKLSDMVVTQYRGTLIDGTEFDSSYKRGQPATFSVQGVIKGWTEALQLMSVGSKWQLFVPAELAYGERGQTKIGPNQVLIFEMELVGIKEPPVRPANPGGASPVTSDIIKVPSKADLDKGAKIEVIKPQDVERLQKEEAAKKTPGDKK
jgi:FKBP-type peptidyl-prolyl cis-trans isomerase